ncbi:peptidylprolyl isomerase [Sphingosinicella sp. LY1275]|uniref:peptidylprolyl isomerase n=1 Tax=Sphingosinicella sp. LY1275 TaxID=3095379 RepID=UPI002ADECB61|nr:peptidylprolyl isomerase [Sphingosinicella sp. LY1275]MEA1013672.1 peptidylprolyl isomerase [Sphingosinicella sp. LY1275]
MFARFALLALAVLPLVPAQAQEPAPATAPQPAVVRVVLETAEGPIVLALEKERAPVTTANFLRYVDGKRLDGVAFYRATPIGQGYGLIQGGVRNDPKRVLPPIAHEPTSQTGLSHVDGAISMARAAPGSANADFFITVGDLVSMDADPKQPGDNQGFAVFGRVVEGMEVVRRILAAPTSPTAGEGAMKGQMLAPPIPIVGARRAD